jgi:hypothetical protein
MGYNFALSPYIKNTMHRVIFLFFKLNGVFVEMAIVTQLVKSFPAFYAAL